MSRDLVFADEIRGVVQASYRAIPRGGGRAVAERFYSSEELSSVPEGAVAWALGVGNPVRHADLRPGEVVLDLGCGGGIDTLLAATRVGPTGRAIGIDLLEEMCERARVAAEEAGVSDRCLFEVGEMGAIPLPDASVDVVISNGAINLSPRKSRVFAEIARVLRPGGRLCAADLTVEDDLPPQVLGSEVSWAGCIAGALSERVLRKKLDRAGFVRVEVGEGVPFGIDDVEQYPLFTPEVLGLMRRLIPREAQERIAVAVILRADKPVAPPKVEEAPPAEPTGVRRLQDVPSSVEAPGVTVRPLKRVEDVELKVLDVEPGGGTPFHTHPHAHEGVVVGGSGRLRLGERTERLRPGDVFYVNPTEHHSVESDGPEPLRFVCMDCFLE